MSHLRAAMKTSPDRWTQAQLAGLRAVELGLAVEMEQNILISENVSVSALRFWRGRVVRAERVPGPSGNRFA